MKYAYVNIFQLSFQEKKIEDIFTNFLLVFKILAHHVFLILLYIAFQVRFQHKLNTPINISVDKKC